IINYQLSIINYQLSIIEDPRKLTEMTDREGFRPRFMIRNKKANIMGVNKWKMNFLLARKSD
ncbi:hypothetical protein, partial [Dapis sp. BLCC M172]|uniref:hypothetical protein n=1 Tax=Dapis sp. BLCC M172 TaxID=2975281 RepID=UPI003CE95ED2